MVYVGVLVKKKNQNLGAKENVFLGKTYIKEREKDKKKTLHILLVAMVIQPWSSSGSTPTTEQLVLSLLCCTKKSRHV